MINSCSNFFWNYTHLEVKKTAKDLIYEPNIKMKIDSKEFDVILNPPLVEDVRIAEPLMTHTYIYPFKLKVALTLDKFWLWWRDYSRLIWHCIVL